MTPFVNTTGLRYVPIDEEHPLRPEDTYSLSKLLDEHILAAFTRAYGIKTVALRLMGVDYPHDRRHTMGSRPEGRPDHVGGPIGGTHQYVDAEDVALACRLSLEAQGLEDFEAFYISTDTTLAEETRPVVERLYPDLKDMAANLSGMEGMISIDKARRKLGYGPQHSWRNQGA